MNGKWLQSKFQNGKLGDNMVGVIPKRDKTSRMNSKDMKSLIQEDRGFTKNCSCSGNQTSAGRVLDPFGGSGTTALVADRHGRDATIIELNQKYVDIAENRLGSDAPLFTEIKKEVVKMKAKVQNLLQLQRRKLFGVWHSR